MCFSCIILLCCVIFILGVDAVFRTSILPIADNGRLFLYLFSLHIPMVNSLQVWTFASTS